jgi:hypothetical protein
MAVLDGARAQVVAVEPATAAGSGLWLRGAGRDYARFPSSSRLLVQRARKITVRSGGEDAGGCNAS